MGGVRMNGECGVAALRIKQLAVLFILSGCFASSVWAVTNHYWHPDITEAVDGFCYVTWFDKTGDTIQLQKISTDGRTQWSSPVQVNTISLTYPAGWEPEPQIAIDGDDLYVVWGRGFQELRMMKLDTDGSRLWPTEQLVNSQPSETLGHDMAVSGGYVYIHYQRYGPSGRASYLAKINSSGSAVWTEDVRSGDGSNQWDQRLVIGGSGLIYAINAYRVDPSTVSTYLRCMNADGTTNWAGVDVGLSEASVATDESHNAIIAGKSGNTVYLKRYDTHGGQVGSTVVVSTNASLPRCTGVTVGEEGMTYVTWEDKRSNYGYDYEVYARRIDSAVHHLWSVDANVNGIDLPDQQNSRIVSHPAGGIMVVWDQATMGGGWVNILANRLDVDGIRSFASDINLHESGNPDVDGDNMSDVWEAAYFGSSLGCSADGDADGDGVSNHGEYIANTVPTNRASRFTVDMSSSLPPTLRFNSSSSRSYRLEGTTSLAPPVTWTPVGEAVSGNGSVVSLTDNDAESRLYYRVRVSVP